MKKSFVVLAMCFFASAIAKAETVEFPENELPTETVLPVFENSRVVLDRNIKTAGRYEFGGGLGLGLSEAFYNPINFSGSFTYHFTEEHALNLSGTFFMSGLNQYGKQLQAGQGLLPGQSFDASLAPAPEWMVFANYQFTAFYGKISLSKQSVMNLTLFGLAGLGDYQTGGVSNIAANVGFGQDFYMTKNLALRFDFSLVMFNGPDATTLTLTTGSAKPDAGAFGKDWFFKTYLSLGMVYLL